jgi:hypothetical protein
MVLGWIAAGMGQAAKQFRRVNGHLHLPGLRAALDQTIAAVTPPRRMPPDHPSGRHPTSMASGTTSDYFGRFGRIVIINLWVAGWGS